jgi:hypothetical protein
LINLSGVGDLIDLFLNSSNPLLIGSASRLISCAPRDVQMQFYQKCLPQLTAADLYNFLKFLKYMNLDCYDQSAINVIIEFFQGFQQRLVERPDLVCCYLRSSLKCLRFRAFPVIVSVVEAFSSPTVVCTLAKSVSSFVTSDDAVQEILDLLFRETERHLAEEVPNSPDAATVCDIDAMLHDVLHLALSVTFEVSEEILRKTCHLVCVIINSGRDLKMDRELFSFLVARYPRGEFSSLILELAPGIRRTVSLLFGRPCHNFRKRFHRFLTIFNIFSEGRSEEETVSFIISILGGVWPEALYQDLVLLIHGSHPNPAAVYHQLQALNR